MLTQAVNFDYWYINNIITIITFFIQNNVMILSVRSYTIWFSLKIEILILLLFKVRKVAHIFLSVRTLPSYR